MDVSKGCSFVSNAFDKYRTDLVKIAEKYLDSDIETKLSEQIFNEFIKENGDISAKNIENVKKLSEQVLESDQRILKCREAKEKIYKDKIDLLNEKISLYEEKSKLDETYVSKYTKVKNKENKIDKYLMKLNSIQNKKKSDQYKLLIDLNVIEIAENIILKLKESELKLEGADLDKGKEKEKDFKNEKTDLDKGKEKDKDFKNEKIDLDKGKPEKKVVLKKDDNQGNSLANSLLGFLKNFGKSDIPSPVKENTELKLKNEQEELKANLRQNLKNLLNACKPENVETEISKTLIDALVPVIKDDIKELAKLNQLDSYVALGTYLLNWCEAIAVDWSQLTNEDWEKEGVGLREDGTRNKWHYTYAKRTKILCAVIRDPIFTNEMVKDFICLVGLDPHKIEGMVVNQFVKKELATHRNSKTMVEFFGK